MTALFDDREAAWGRNCCISHRLSGRRMPLNANIIRPTVPTPFGEPTTPGATDAPVIKYIWPLWIGLILQLATNLAGDFVFGENSAFADWVFGRNCDDIACGGKVWLSMWGTVAVLTVVNAIVWGITDLVRNYRRRKVQYHRGGQR